MMQDSNMTMETAAVEVNSTLEAMLRQEQAYVAEDYLYQSDRPESGANGPLHKEESTVEQDRAKMVG